MIAVLQLPKNIRGLRWQRIYMAKPKKSPTFRSTDGHRQITMQRIDDRGNELTVVKAPEQARK
jgi:hypothetical protein